MQVRSDITLHLTKWPFFSTVLFAELCTLGHVQSCFISWSQIAVAFYFFSNLLASIQLSSSPISPRFSSNLRSSSIFFWFSTGLWQCKNQFHFETIRFFYGFSWKFLEWKSSFTSGHQVFLLCIFERSSTQHLQQPLVNTRKINLSHNFV